MRDESEPHVPGCLGNHLGDCAVSGLFDRTYIKHQMPDGRTCDCIGGEANFHGHWPRECGEHRTVGTHRAWCLDCTEWCYPRMDAACKGCEIVHLRNQLESRGER